MTEDRTVLGLTALSIAHARDGDYEKAWDYLRQAIDQRREDRFNLGIKNFQESLKGDDNVTAIRTIDP